MTNILIANNQSDFECIAQLADTIWREHYISIISLEQIEYMLINFNSASAIEAQIKQGALFFYITFNDIPVGYVAVKKETDFLFLSKIYVLSTYRGKKIGKAALQHVVDMANSFKLNTIKLNVNKFNTNSIMAYEKLGFIKIKSIITDIGNGFIMDDYQMEKTM
jgi:ribosomal protein S18 acetylase RimI-like enzyme